MTFPTPFELAMLAQGHAVSMTGRPIGRKEAIATAWESFQTAAEFIEDMRTAHTKAVNIQREAMYAVTGPMTQAEHDKSLSSDEEYWAKIRREAGTPPTP